MNEFLIEKLKNTYKEEVVNKIINGLSKKKYSTFRINYIKSSLEEIENYLIDNNIKYEKIVNFDNAFVVDKKYNLAELDIYKNGKIYLQSLSSMIPVFILEPKENENILDMCASPGSKTTMIQSITNNKVNLTAVELHKSRYEKLIYNLNLQNVNAYTINKNVLDLDNLLKYDKVLLDAPCSGSGILDINNENYKKYFTDALIKKCISSQMKMIEKASNLLKKGGKMVYSTCSLLKEENENMIEYALKKGFSIEKINFLENQNKEFIKIIPDELYEGFFVSSFIKN